MSRANRALLLLAVSFLVLVCFAAAKRKEPAAFGIAPGMTPDEVRQRLGPPKRIARQILYHRYREQWIYDPPHPARLQFDCPRGQKPALLWIAPR